MQKPLQAVLLRGTVSLLAFSQIQVEEQAQRVLFPQASKHRKYQGRASPRHQGTQDRGRRLL